MKTYRQVHRVLSNASLTIFFLAAFLHFCATACVGQQLDDDLLKRRVTLHVKDGTLLEALDRLANQEAIPIGWEVSQNDVVKHDLNFDFEKTPLKDVLDHVALADPSYRWNLEGGVINFYPTFNRDDSLQDLLSVRIKEFNMPKGLSVYAVRDAILDLPEVNSFLLSNGFKASHGGNCCGGTPSTLNFEFQIANTELRTLLNKLIREGHLRFWILSRTGESRKLIHLAL
jgi:hypothetical protein